MHIHKNQRHWFAAFSTALLAVVIVPRPALADHAQATAALAQRVLGARASEFQFASISSDNGCDVFEVSCKDGKAEIKGSSPVAMASGLNWYLKYHCNASVSWCGDQLDVPKPLPSVETFRKTTPYGRRYYFNYCTFSYTMAWWDWPRWEREIDWMALNGINMPLSVTGQEAVWQAVYRGLGLTDDELASFFVGPAYLPFGWMGCMDGWGGPLTQDWIDRHCELEKRIVARERELGMTPVLQGFTGHVPGALKSKFPEANLRQTSPWCGFPATNFLDPSDALFVRIGKAFIEEQTRQYGTDHLYASDTFIEMSPPSDDPAFLDAMGKAVFESISAADPEAVWVMQGWIFFNNPKFWKPAQSRAFLGAVPDDHMILLDLFCETKPVWLLTEAFYGKPWLWCIVHNFGGNLTLQGELAAIATGIPAAMASPGHGRLRGIGMMMEGIEQNPVVYDLMTEMTWRTEAPELKTWVRDYARRRYGRENAGAEEAWQRLLESAYSVGGGTTPPICARPSLGSGICTTPGYDPLKLLNAWETLAFESPELGSLDTYQYDQVNIGRQVLADFSSALCRRILDAYRDKDAKRLGEAGRQFTELIEDMNQLLATRKEFLLGRWLAAAEAWGTNVEQRRHYEWNARNQITLWGPRFSPLHEYAAKQWAGLLNGFYLPRWRMFLERLEAGLKNAAPFDAEAFQKDVTAWEETWTHLASAYPVEPHGDPTETTRKLIVKYAPMLIREYDPEVVSLTTNKPVTCLSALPPYPARLANDGRAADTNQYWASDISIDKDPWWQVDLGKPETVGRVVVVCYYGDEQHYGFTVKTSLDGQAWETVADLTKNKERAKPEGYKCKFDPRPVRYIRINHFFNFANADRRLVEVMAFAK